MNHAGHSLTSDRYRIKRELGQGWMGVVCFDPHIRIDYPVWSPDGRWILFDRLKPEGGDTWLLGESPRRR